MTASTARSTLLLLALVWMAAEAEGLTNTFESFKKKNVDFPVTNESLSDPSYCNKTMAERGLTKKNVFIHVSDADLRKLCLLRGKKLSMSVRTRDLPVTTCYPDKYNGGFYGVYSKKPVVLKCDNGEPVHFWGTGKLPSG